VVSSAGEAARRRADEPHPMPFSIAIVAAYALAARLAVPQGVYEDCAPSDGNARCLRRLHSIAAGGFSLVIDYSQFYGSAADELAYASTAKSLGIRVIWNFSEPAFWNGSDLRRHFPGLAATCGCVDNAGFVRYAVSLVRDLPATWGYYVGDETPPSDHDRLRDLTHRIATLDPTHPRLFVGVGDPSLALTRSAIAPFADAAEILGGDYYPVSTGVPLARAGDAAKNVGRVAAWMRRRCAVVIQAFDWSQYPGEAHVCAPYPACARYPSEYEMREMRDLAVANAHPALILWYSYFDVVRSNAPKRHWSDLVEAAGAR
jgi:hypothetical protein